MVWEKTVMSGRSYYFDPYRCIFLLCFSMDNPKSVLEVLEWWAHTSTERHLEVKKYFIVGLKSDCCTEKELVAFQNMDEFIPEQLQHIWKGAEKILTCSVVDLEKLEELLCCIVKVTSVLQLISLYKSSYGMPHIATLKSGID